MTFIAANPGDVESQVDQALSFAQKASEQALHPVLMLDAAFDTEAGNKGLSGMSKWALYAETQWHALGDSGPLLYPLPPSTSDCRKFLWRALHHAKGRPMASMLVSRTEVFDLLTYWRPMVAVIDPDGDSMLLRWADTRCSVCLPNALSPEHWRQLTNPLGAWWVVNRFGEWEALPLQTAPGHSLAGEALEISAAELGALIEAGMPDSILAVISDQVPDLLPEAARASAYQTATRALELGKKHGISGTPDLVALTIFALGEGDEALGGESLLEILRSHSGSGLPLSKRLQSLL
jgi:hypothetical protein